MRISTDRCRIGGAVLEVLHYVWLVLRICWASVQVSPLFSSKRTTSIFRGSSKSGHYKFIYKIASLNFHTGQKHNKLWLKMGGITVCQWPASLFMKRVTKRCQVFQVKQLSGSVDLYEISMKQSLSKGGFRLAPMEGNCWNGLKEAFWATVVEDPGLLLIH